MNDYLDEQIQDLQAQKRHIKHLMREERLRQNAKDREERKRERIRKLKSEVADLAAQAESFHPDLPLKFRSTL